MWAEREQDPGVVLHLTRAEAEELAAVMNAVFVPMPRDGTDETDTIDWTIHTALDRVGIHPVREYETVTLKEID